MDWNLRVRGLGDELISAWDTKRIAALPKDEKERLRCIVDAAGERSARAQGLGAVITDLSRVQSNGHLLYLAATFSSGTTKLLGLLKVGRKKLFIRVDSGALKEIEPLCVLDFYVHESCQRSGLGSKLMTRMLQDKAVAPARLGYDRPSPKLLSFLKKHHGLSDYIPQSNNFVVFSQYWEAGSNKGSMSSQIDQQRNSRSSSRSEGVEDGHGSAPRRVAAAAAPEAGRSGTQQQQQQQQQLGRRAALPPPALPPDPLADSVPLSRPAASHTTTTVTGARPPSLSVHNHPDVPGSEGIIDPQYSPPNQPRFGRRASGERGVSPMHPPGGSTPPSAVHQHQQHQVSPPQSAAPGGYGYPHPPQPYQQPPRYPPGYYTYHAQPGHHPYQTPPSGPGRAAAPHQAVPPYLAAPPAPPQQQSHHRLGHQAQQYGPPRTRAEAGFSPPLGAAGHLSHHQRYPAGQCHDRHPHHHGYNVPSPNHVSKIGVAPPWGHQEQDSLSVWQGAKGASAAPPPPHPISRSNSAIRSSSHQNSPMPPAAYSMPIPAPPGSHYNHNRHQHPRHYHGAPAAHRAARVSPAKAMALRQQEGNGAKGALAW